jgi:hypothetical protein
MLVSTQLHEDESHGVVWDMTAPFLPVCTTPVDHNPIILCIQSQKSSNSLASLLLPFLYSSYSTVIFTQF